MAQKTIKRIAGYDLARGVAVFGMILMNFKIVMQDPLNSATNAWAVFLQAFEGRFGALFIVLAGIGVSLFTRRARTTNDGKRLNANKKTCLKGLDFSLFWACCSCRSGRQIFFITMGYISVLGFFF
jgi:uncharacterized protein